MESRPLLAATVSASLAGILLSAFVHSDWASPTLYSDIASFWGRGWLQSGQVPYTNGAFLEYPPVSGLVLYGSRVIGGSIAGIFGSIYSGYYLAFSALSLAAAGVLGWSTWRIARSLGVKVNPVYFLLPSMVVYGIYNFDLFNALFIMLSIQFFLEKKRGWSAAFLGVALATKFIAIVILPVFLLELSKNRERAKYLVTSFVVGGAFFLPVLVFNSGYFGQFFSFYSNWGLEDAWYIWIFGDPFSRTAKFFGLVILVVLLARVYTLRMPPVNKSFLALSAYLLAAFIYAPQFNVVLVPLAIVLAITSPSLYFLEIFNALIILTWFTVPATPTSGPTYPWTLPQTMALLRSASLALLCLSLASESGHSFRSWLAPKLGLPEPSAQSTL